MCKDADAILKDRSGVYVFEFKYGKTLREALDQARGIDDPIVEP